MTSILGISAFYHDSAAAIIVDGNIVAAAQEERFTRKKHDPSYPHNAIEFVLNYANLKLNEVDQIVFFEKPFLKFERLLETYVAFAPRGFISFAKSMPLWIKEKLFQKKLFGLFHSISFLNTLEQIRSHDVDILGHVFFLKIFPLVPLQLSCHLLINKLHYRDKMRKYLILSSL